jgi:hypothetical protein
MFAIDCSVKKVGDSLFLTPSERKNSRIKKDSKFSVETFYEGFVSVRVPNSNVKYNIMNCDFYAIVGEDVLSFKEAYSQKRTEGIKNLISALKEQGFVGSLSGVKKQEQKEKKGVVSNDKSKRRKGWIKID